MNAKSITNAITTQDELNSLQYYDVIYGDLIVENFSVEIDFSVLNDLTEISGSFIIVNNSFTHIGDFPLLTTIRGNFDINNNSNLSNIVGFTSLTHCRGINISHNPSMVYIPNFSSLTTIDNVFSIHHMSGLSNVSAEYESFVNSSAGGIVISNNDNLLIVDGFKYLVEIEYVNIMSNFKLLRVNGFDNLNLNGTHVFFTNNKPNADYSDSKITPSSIDNLTKYYSQGISSIFNNQNELNVLINCNDIIGDLIIRDFSGQPDFSVLNKITNILGDFIVIENMFEEINGFSSLTTIKGKLDIYNNSNLKHIYGFNNLSTIGGDFNVHKIDKLYSFSGFNCLKNIGGNLDISNNSKLYSISGFNNVNFIEGNCGIKNNSKLHSLEGFQQLCRIGGSLNVLNNEKLFSIYGFQNYLIRNTDNIQYVPVKRIKR